MNDQLQIDLKIKQIYPVAIVGQKFIFGNKEYTYKGTDIIYEQIDDLSRDFGDIMHLSNSRAMLMNPTGYRPQPFILDPSVKAALTGNLAGAITGELGSMLSKEIASGALGDGLSGQAGDILGGIAGTAAGAAIGGALGGRVGAIAGGLSGALTSGLGGALGDLAGNFIPPGLDGPISAVTGAFKQLTKALPIGGSGAADIVNKVLVVKTLLGVNIKGPGSLLFGIIGSKLLSDIPGLDALNNVVNLQTQVAGLAALASNPIAFAAQAALMQTQFPMIDMNKLAAKMIAGAAIGALGGRGFNIRSMVPNLALAAGIMALKALPGVTPTKDAEKIKRVPRAPKPVKPIQLKNLFAEAAAGSSLSTLTQPLSAFMGLLATVAPPTALVAPSPRATSMGTQKLVNNANSVNWGSGGYGRNTELEKQERRRAEVSALIERHTSELMTSVDYSVLTKYSYPDLLKKYPRITSTMTVVEALAIIEEDDKIAAERAKAANTTSTMTG